MSLINVLPHYRAQLDSLGLSEWRDAFNIANIPSTLLNKNYHLELGSTQVNQSSHLSHSFIVPIKVTVFLHGYRDTSQAMDDALVEVESIYSKLLLPATKYTINIKSIQPSSFSILPLDGSNDNALLIEMEFNNQIEMQF